VTTRGLGDLLGIPWSYDKITVFLMWHLAELVDELFAVDEVAGKSVLIRKHISIVCRNKNNNLFSFCLSRWPQMLSSSVSAPIISLAVGLLK
jgi:hypothetical protein